MIEISKPGPDEYGEYYETYVSKVPEGDLLASWTDVTERTSDLLAELSDDRAEYRYADGKWSIKELIGHLSDAERFFAGRALWIARGESTPLPGYDQDSHMEVADFDRLPLADLLTDLTEVRRSNQRLFRTFSAEDLARVGTANELPLSVRAVAYIIVGHGLHHLGVIEERYAAAFG